jgi:hypothetical protein
MSASSPVLTEEVKFELWLDVVQREAEARQLQVVEVARMDKVLLLRLAQGAAVFLPVLAKTAVVVDTFIDVKASLNVRDQGGR